MDLLFNYIKHFKHIILLLILLYLKKKHRMKKENK